MVNPLLTALIFFIIEGQLLCLHFLDFCKSLSRTHLLGYQSDKNHGQQQDNDSTHGVHHQFRVPLIFSRISET